MNNEVQKESTVHDMKGIVKELVLGFFKSYNFSLLTALIILCILMSVLSPYFFTWNNILNIGLAASVAGTMAAGLTVYMLMGAIELSQYATSAFCGTLLGVLLQAQWGIWPAILIVLLVSCAMGCFNATLLTVGRIPPIIVTLGTMCIFRGSAYWLTSAKNIPLNNLTLRFIGQGRILSVPVSVYVLLISFLIAGFVLKHTSFGRKVYAVGANPQAAFLSGISINRTCFAGMVIAAFFSGIAGILGTAQVMTSIPSSGVGSEIEIITCVLIGGLGIAGGKGKISGVFLGMMILMVINNGMTLLSIQAYYQLFVRGIVLLLAVLIDTLRGGGFKS